MPWNDLGNHLLGNAFARQHIPPERPSLLYLKTPFDTYESASLSEEVTSSAFANGLTIDNPRETPTTSVHWFAEKVRDSDAVLVHLLSDDQEDTLRHNIKCSFVAGIARGMNKPVLMLAHAPFRSPMDYVNLLREHRNAVECQGFSSAWLKETFANLPPRPKRRPVASSTPSPTLQLRSLSLGEPVAENEHFSLDDYFLETSAYYEALDSHRSIFVGRRGTGKSANYFALFHAIRADKRNHACAVKPVGYEVEGVVRVLEENLHRSERGYLVESLWKFLIYTQLASSVADEVADQPPYYEPTKAERTLRDYVAQNKDLIEAPFSSRLDRAIRLLRGIGDISDTEVQRARISEHLHTSMIGTLRRLLGDVLTTKHKVAILIDNLDEPWGPSDRVDPLADLLLGLLRTAGDIGEDFGQAGLRGKKADVSVTIFLRSDIFFHMASKAAEQDKLPLKRIVWDDPEMLIRVVEERLLNAVGRRFPAEEIWTSLFPESVNGVPLKTFITSTTMPRPRDVIYLVKEAVAQAVNRGHTVVTQDDINAGRRRYSDYAFYAIVAEDDPKRARLEIILIQFSRSPQILSRSEVEELIRSADVPDADVSFYLNLLLDLNFLGVDSVGGYRFSADEGERQRLLQVARAAAAREAREETYQISAAFHDVLQVRS
jgi:hypothetical protein